LRRTTAQKDTAANAQHSLNTADKYKLSEVTGAKKPEIPLTSPL